MGERQENPDELTSEDIAEAAAVMDRALAHLFLQLGPPPTRDETSTDALAKNE
ncbi:hypothetical protein ABT282_08460 [Streptomyces sp. NPDC000927]|uniref:hypothetical protein n=1 Tax=Streptomyces sp. NPDC000927 TaxID=3154371 RepID=UPI003320F751